MLDVLRTVGLRRRSVAAPHGPDEDVFGSVFEVDELDDLRPVPAFFGPQRVRGDGGQPLFEDPMPRDGQQTVAAHPSGNFVLAAGDGKDYAGIPADGLCQGVVRGRVARVQRHDEINPLSPWKAFEIDDLLPAERKTVQTKLPRKPFASLHNAGVTVQPDDGDLAAVNDGE